MDFAGYTWDLGVIAAFVATAAAVFSARTAAKISRRNSDVSKVLELISVHREWASDVRSETAKFLHALSQLTDGKKVKSEMLSEMSASLYRLQLFLPIDDKDTGAIMNNMTYLIKRATPGVSEPEHDEFSKANLVKLVQKLTNKENNRLITLLEKL